MRIERIDLHRDHDRFLAGIPRGGEAPQEPQAIGLISRIGKCQGQ